MDNKINNFVNNSRKETEEVVERTLLDQDMEAGFNLDSESLQGCPSTVSMILDSPKETDADAPSSQPAPRKERAKRLSNAQKRRYTAYLKKGHSRDEARTLALRSSGRPDLPGQAAIKRQRSDDVPSPNTSADRPANKKSRGRNGDGPSVPRHSVGVTYKEMVDAINIAITLDGYPTKLLSKEQLGTVHDSILDQIAALDSPLLRPKFRSCHFKHGYLYLACADNETVVWLEKTIPVLTPWDGAQLRVYNTDDLPKVILFAGYFSNSVDTSNEKILRFIQNQNEGISALEWRVRNRKVAGKTVELFLEIDEKSATHITEQRFLLNYMFGKARMRQVGRPTTNARKGTSVAKRRKVHAERSVQAPPPTQSNLATNRKVQTERPVSPSPPDQRNPAMEDKVQQTASNSSTPQPLSIRKPATERKVPQKTPRSTLPQPSSARKPRSQKPPSDAGHVSVAHRLQQASQGGVGVTATQSSSSADGNRLKGTGSSDPTTDVSNTQ